MIYKLVMAVHIALYRLTRGRLGGKSIVLLTFQLLKLITAMPPH